MRLVLSMQAIWKKVSKGADCILSIRRKEVDIYYDSKTTLHENYVSASLVKNKQTCTTLLWTNAEFPLFQKGSSFLSLDQERLSNSTHSIVIVLAYKLELLLSYKVLLVGVLPLE